ncbi:hypothetical protein BMETH_3155_0 [methanotrophic bacterial endosymbiont of Bathymodiolus sp.]|nr:hypothetical protein BMETH_3155_0 [methanotrophic bacterial endosymbiont of Bathymodiolus sp.]
MRIRNVKLTVGKKISYALFQLQRNRGRTKGKDDRYLRLC